MSIGRGTQLKASVVVLFVAAVAYAKITGPEAGYTGAPGDIGNCVVCHDTFHVANAGPGSVRINNLPAVYQPGQRYNFSVTTQQSGRSRFGFQVTALTLSGLRAGTLAPLDSNTQLNADTGFGGRQYIEHTQVGSAAMIAGSQTWQLQWTAPSSDVGTVRFFVAGNAANNDGTNQEDYIYTSLAFSDSPTSSVSISLLSNPAGQTLNAGSTYLINWSVTGQSNIDNIEARYSTDDGATFPISNLIFSTTDPGMSSYEWTVPDKPTTEARLRLTVGKKSGDAASPAISGAFTIVASGGGSSAPSIASVAQTGKKLFISGNNFQQGAKLYLNGEKQKTNNEDEFGQLLRCKKAGKKVAPGETVSLVVINPDGGQSAAFLYTRPIE